MIKPLLRVLPVAVVLLLAGCGGAGNESSKPSAPVTVRLELARTTVQAGTPIKGEAIFTNTTKKTIAFPHYCPNEWLQVGLDGKHYQYENWSLLMLCGPVLRLPPGASKFPFTISTTYGSCIETKLGGEGKGIPPCTGAGDGEEPPLPAGTYTTKTFIEVWEAPVAPPITVTLLPRIDGSPASSPPG